jgi:hypothetical protein
MKMKMSLTRTGRKPIATFLATALLVASWVGDPASARAAEATQDNWRFCDKCNVLFFNGAGNKGRCPGGGGHNAQGLDFVLPYGNLPEVPNAQINWRFCDKCFAMFWDGIPNKGRCPAGGGHHAQGFLFRLPHDIKVEANNQGDWRYCTKCEAMFFDGAPRKGVCPAGGGHVAQGFKFVLSHRGDLIQSRAEVPPPPRPLSPGFKFGRVANQTWLGGVTVINNIRPPKAGVSVNLMPIMKAKWEEGRAKLTNDALAFLNEHDVGRGWRTSKNRLNLAQSGPLYIGNDGTGFTLRFSLPGNSLATWLRTPTGASEDVDPGFQVSFDLDLTIDLDVRGNRIVAGPARLQANVQRPVGTNLTGKGALAAADLLKNFLGGPDFIGRMLAMVNGREFAFDSGINPELAKLNPVLDQAAGVGEIVPGYDAGSKSATLTLVPASKEPVVR